MPTKSFHNIATRYSSKYAIAIGDVEPILKTNGHATLFDLETRVLVCDFPVRYECAGGVRHTLSCDERMCIAGCYDAYGIAGYSIPEGREIWRRKDLKAVQSVEPLYDQDWVFCGRERGPAHLLEASTGKTVEKLTGVKTLFASPVDTSVVLCGKSVDIHRPLGRKVASLKRGGYLRQAAFSKDSVLLDDSMGLRCVDLASGAVVWKSEQDDKLRYWVVDWSSTHACFLASTSRGQIEHLAHIDPSTGKVLNEFNIDGRGTGAFCHQGDYWLNGDLRLISTSDGTLVHDFTTDAILRRDPRHKHDLLLSLATNTGSAEELERYMVTEGFNVVDIRKAVLLREAEILRKRRSS